MSDGFLKTYFPQQSLRISFIRKKMEIFFLESFLKKIFYVYFLREKQSVCGGGAESGGDTESEAGSGLRAVGTEPDVGLELVN